MAELVVLNSSIIYIAIGIGIINIGLLSGLIYFYWGSYKDLKSKFTVGLLYFSGILLAQNVLVTMALAALLILGKELNQFEGTEHYSILLLVNLAQLIALIILSKITWE
ncbi:MAG TPA: hypothetical protein VMC48_02555 [Methanobacterium sp.]|nr:hypothetical protein [Methanobacterium sp.]